MASANPAKSHAKTEKTMQIVFSVADTKYAVVRYVGRRIFGWRLSSKPDDSEWDVMWTDNAVEPDRLTRMKPYQKINHFPGMYALARKNHLARNLSKMQRVHPEDYAFFPRTWLMPAEYSELRLFMTKSKNKTFIVKPEASCQGRGIFLTRRIEDINPQEHCVVQQYITKPFLLDDYKFDLRIYVLVTGCNPLRIFVHEEGLARLATEKYSSPKAGNMKDICMHLTNYAVNKNNPNFIFNTSVDKANVGHKRSLTSTMQFFSEQGYNTADLWEKIHDMVVKTLLSVQPALSHTYRSCQPEDHHNAMCFELLGLDVILDSKFRPYLLEVNHSPSFTADSPLDRSIKRKVISEALTLINVDSSFKPRFLAQQKSEVLERTLKGRTIKQSKEMREFSVMKAIEQRNVWENAHLGGFTKVYPRDDAEKYDRFLETANGIWNMWTGSNKSKARSATPLIGATSRCKTSMSKPTTNLPPKIRSISNSQLLEPEDASPKSPPRTPNVFVRLARTPVKAARPIALSTHYSNLVETSDCSDHAEKLSRMFPNFHILLPPAPPKPASQNSLIRTLQLLLKDEKIAREQKVRQEGEKGTYVVPRSVNFTPLTGLGRQYV